MLSYIFIVLYIFWTAFMQPHFIFRTIPHGQYANICNEMGEIFLECFMKNIFKKVAFLSTHNPPYSPSNGWESEMWNRENTWETHRSVKPSTPRGNGKKERLRNKSRQLVRHGDMPSFLWLKTQEGIWESGSHFESKSESSVVHGPPLKCRDRVKVAAGCNWAKFYVTWKRYRYSLPSGKQKAESHWACSEAMRWEGRAAP